MRNQLFASYMRHVRGEKHSLLWSVLTPIGYANRAVAVCRDFLYKHGLMRVEESPVPLISIGNLTYGGTNKTPFVEMLTQMLLSKIKIGIVSRGYSGGHRDQKAIVIINGNADRVTVGDEPLLLSKHLPDIPIAVARKRIDGVRALHKLGVELVIADDAFQHRGLGRDVDIVLIDASCPFGNKKLLPAGSLREMPWALSRAHMVVLTKVDQASPENLAELRRIITEKGHVPAERIFTSRVKITQWQRYSRFPDAPVIKHHLPVLAFSAIGNPESFKTSLTNAGLRVVHECQFQDHHQYTVAEMQKLCELAQKSGAEALCCTEKDLYNFPESSTSPILRDLALAPNPSPALFVPIVNAELDEPGRFHETLIRALKPRVVVASNGYGEDAIGVLLARRLRIRFPNSEILAFPLVGRGDAYREAGFTVKSAPSVTPSGGVVKYRLRDLWGDLRAGLLHHVSAQLQDWNALRGTIRTPLCVGDVYLLLHTLWGNGVRPLFIATAKTVHLSGHWHIERALIRKLALRTWTRDPESAEQLIRAHANAVYAGSPIMDLIISDPEHQSPVAKFYAGQLPEPPDANAIPLVLLLPGSRLRAYQDVNLLLDAALLLNAARPCTFRMVLAPTLSMQKLVESCEGWHVSRETCNANMTMTNSSNTNKLERENVFIELTDTPIAEAARGVSLLIGLGGTANQLCAGLGIPVISIDEKGKRVQKKLLGDSEILVPPTAKDLADCALRVLSDPTLFRHMSTAGRERMGEPGALDDMTNFLAKELGLELRDRLYKNLCQNKNWDR